MTRIRRSEFLLTLISFVATGAWEIGHRGRHPFHDLSNGAYTDHFSHLNSTRLLPRVGLEIWRKPLSGLLRPLSRSETAALPPDLREAGREGYFVPGWPRDKPMVASWTHGPRFYPPGDAVLFAPVALLYHFGPISFSTACLLALLLLLVYAHVALYFVLVSGASWIEALIVWFPVVHWTLEGFYDAAMFVPLILCARRRGIEAVLAFCAAVFIHFRALFFVPWALFAAVAIVRERQFRSWGRREWAMAAGAAALSIAALVPFALLQGSLAHLAFSNRVSMAMAPALRPATIAFLAVCGLAAVLFRRAGARLDLALLAWIALMLFSLHQAEQWHALALLPWLCAPIAARDEPRARQVRLWFVLCAAAIVFRESLLPTWLPQLL
ncbi:MAG: hypothetical protein ABR567_04020 [Myxococcales bacterium]